MGGSQQSGAAEQAYGQEQYLSSETYSLGSGALKGGLSYLTNAYKGGGYDQSQKYSALQGLTMDATANATPAARAQAMAGVTSQKVSAGLDEMNKLRSMLSGQGLSTTSLAEQAGGQSVSALRGMYPGNQTENLVKGGLALGSSIYGAGSKAGWWGGTPGGNSTGSNQGSGSQSGGQP